MNKQEVYRLLEEKMLAYADYATVPVKPRDERLVFVLAGENLVARQIGTDMLPYTGNKIYVRAAVLEKLLVASKLLVQTSADLQLEVVYGYRALEVQTRLFEKYKAKLQDQYKGKELLEAVHRLISIPDVAGHPAGAAVDIQIIKGGKPLDFGTKIWEFVPDSYTFSPFVSCDAWNNRQLLRHIMMRAGFAPFDGEWWHFSYGDKEWAKYYAKSHALYDQVSRVHKSWF